MLVTFELLLQVVQLLLLVQRQLDVCQAQLTHQAALLLLLLAGSCGCIALRMLNVTEQIISGCIGWSAAVAGIRLQRLCSCELCRPLSRALFYLAPPLL
jgi:hypothetical protein